MPEPFLSICLPTRNRQIYLATLLAFLSENRRPDVEIVVGDNSDDPAPVAALVDALADPRIRLLPPAERALSMRENWERTAALSTGRWIIMAGDDDLVDPDLADAVALAARLKPGLEALSWNMMSYDWRTGDSPPQAIAVHLGAEIIDLDRDFLFRRAFHWENAGAKLSCGMSIYHSAWSRALFEKVSAFHGGALFGHPTVDYDSAFKAIALGRSFAFSTRPFSIFGTSPVSNSAAGHSLARMREANAIFAAELGRAIDEPGGLADFPFPSTLGLTAAVAQVQRSAMVALGIRTSGWEARFARACADNCSFFRDPEEFDVVAEGYRTAFARWQNGRFLGHFTPRFEDRPRGLPFTGLNGKDLHVDAGIAGASDPTSFYRAINAILAPASAIEAKLKRAAA